MPEAKTPLTSYLLLPFAAFLTAAAALVAAGYARHTGPCVVLMFVSLALYFMGHRFLRSIAFTIWVLAFVAAAMYYPGAFGIWLAGTPLEMDLKILIVPLIQIIMFGMGTTLSGKDFLRVIAMPWPVLIGMVLQFTVMPVAGYAIATALEFEAEVAAGVILVGSCPGGVASNLMTYLARGNVALSVTMTACSTLVSPLMTPFLMETLAGRLVPVNFVAMMLSILNMVIVPIAAGLIANKILYGRGRLVHGVAPLVLIALAGTCAAVGASFVDPSLLAAMASLKGGIVLGSALVGAVALAKLVVEVLCNGPEHWMDKTLPIVSMAGICFIIAIITSRSQQKLLTVGTALIAASILHNFIGYVLGYWSAKAARLSETSCRTVAIEVGLQNGGMASGLAMDVLHSSHAALAPAIFGPWMNVSGSILATWWHRKPTDDGPPAALADLQSEPAGE
ncbi:MAG: bile acid:sodium symporter family protein [Pirellulales bacterium]|nr:bile acid:sodium symporter family protein [Pirellulales bacterium]